MAIEDMIRRIMDEARSENQRILQEARKEADRLKEVSRKEVDVEISEKERRLEKEIEQTRNIYISDGKRKARQALLSSKEELIWDAICSIREKIKELDGEGLRSYIDPMVSRTIGMIGSDARVYAVRERDSKILTKNIRVTGLVQDLMDESEMLSKYRGTDLLGGFIAASPNGERVVDMTFHGLLDRNDERIREMIADRLFKDL
ncbi:MAG: V-type ATP synthase subunit E [Thermoplasmatota archaeon]